MIGRETETKERSFEYLFNFAMLIKVCFLVSLSQRLVIEAILFIPLTKEKNDKSKMNLKQLNMQISRTWFCEKRSIASVESI